MNNNDILIIFLDKLHSILIKNLLHKLNQLVKLSQSESPTKKQLSSDESIIQVINVLDTLLPFLLVYIASSDSIINRINEDLIVEIRKLLYFIASIFVFLYFYF